MQIPFFNRRRTNRERKWAPRAQCVVAEARLVGPPSPTITPVHLLLALERGDSRAAKILKALAISPSAVLGSSPLELRASRDTDPEVDWDADWMRDLERIALEEAEHSGHRHVGTKHLLLAVSRIGVAGVDLPYDRIREMSESIQKKG